MNYPWLQPIIFEHPPQAVCITGVAGLGQADLAEQFAKTLLNAQQLSLHPDFLRLTPEAGKSIGIDAVRAIQDFSLLTPTHASRKVVCIDEAHLLTIPAQQAFLKTLEEPLAALTFILLTTNVNQLLPTLRSRCQILTIPCVPYAQAKIWFEQTGLSVSSTDYTLTDGGPLIVLAPEFQERLSAYQYLSDVFKRQAVSLDIQKKLNKAEPLNVLTGFYYAALHQKQFTILDACIDLRQQYSKNANLNWEMQLNSFIIEAQSYVV